MHALFTSGFSEWANNELRVSGTAEPRVSSMLECRPHKVRAVHFSGETLKNTKLACACGINGKGIF